MKRNIIILAAITAFVCLAGGVVILLVNSRPTLSAADRQFAHEAGACNPSAVLDYFSSASVNDLKMSQAIVLGYPLSPTTVRIDQVLRGKGVRNKQVIGICDPTGQQITGVGYESVIFLTGLADDVPNTWLLPGNAQGVIPINHDGTVDLSSAGGSPETPLAQLSE